MIDNVSNRPRNILYIFTDDQSFRSVSCNPGAHPWVNTPNNDRLAREGVRFANCYTGAWCAPSRATYLTGKLQHELLAEFRQGTIDELRRTDAGMVDNPPPVIVLTKEQLLGGV